MQKQLMNLKVFLPFQILFEKNNISRIVVETSAGSCGILPHRLDCVGAIVPGILIFQPDDGNEVYVAVNEGVLIKIGLDVMVSVREAVVGTDLAKLHKLVEKEYLIMNEQEKNVKSVITKMESSFIHRLMEVHNE